MTTVKLVTKQMDLNINGIAMKGRISVTKDRGWRMIESMERMSMK